MENEGQENTFDSAEYNEIVEDSLPVSNQHDDDEQIVEAQENHLSIVNDIVDELDDEPRSASTENVAVDNDNQDKQNETLNEQPLQQEESHDNIENEEDVEKLPTAEVSVEKTWSMDIRGLADQFNTNDKQINSSDAKTTNEKKEDSCFACNRRVYPMERFVADKRVYHKTCFKCSKCRRTLGVDFAVNNGELFCKPHFMEMFKMRGRYDDNLPDKNQQEKQTSSPPSESTNQLQENEGLPPTAVTKGLLAKFRAMETGGGSGAGGATDANSTGEINKINKPIRETNDVNSDGLIRSQDASAIVKDELPPPDVTKSMAAKWKAMELGAAPTPEASVQQQKKSRQLSGVNANVRLPTNATVAGGDDVNKEKSIPDVLSNESNNHHDETSENVPELSREDVVRSAFGEIREGEMPEAGTTRNLLSLFQKSQ